MTRDELIAILNESIQCHAIKSEHEDRPDECWVEFWDTTILTERVADDILRAMGDPIGEAMAQYPKTRAALKD